jgi:hypothetical protein
MDLGTMNAIVISSELSILNDNRVGNYSFMYKKKLMDRPHAFKQRGLQTCQKNVGYVPDDARWHLKIW